MNRILRLAGGRTWELRRPQVMGILNATPDSFSDGGRLDNPDDLHRSIDCLLTAGADCLDVGGESTRPGHTPVPADEEIRRVVPVIEAIRSMDRAIPISIDTSKARVARAAIDAGADLVNDVTGLRDPNMAALVKDAECSIVLMRHETLHEAPLDACRQQFAALLQRAHEVGVARDRIVLDPGLGFAERPGPNVEDNLTLLDGATAIADGRPVLIGHSRKRFVASMAQEAGVDRDVMTARLSRRAVDAGATIVRVHDVAATVAALG